MQELICVCPKRAKCCHSYQVEEPLLREERRKREETEGRSERKRQCVWVRMGMNEWMNEWCYKGGEREGNIIIREIVIRKYFAYNLVSIVKSYATEKVVYK